MTARYPIKNHEMCCGNGCDKEQLTKDFESMANQIQMLKRDKQELETLLSQLVDDEDGVFESTYS